jgi:hypothetical protein
MISPSSSWFRFVSSSLFALASLPAAAHADPATVDACPSVEIAADDVRETYDAQNRLVRQLRLSRGHMVGDAVLVYDDAGHLVERTETVDGHQRALRASWSVGRQLGATCEVDGLVVAQVTLRYDGDKLVAKDETSSAGPPRTTLLHYDATGQLALTEVKSPSGDLLSRTEATNFPPRTPVELKLSAGGTYQSDTRLVDATAAVGIQRKPLLERYRSDPLEVALDGALRFNRAKGVTATDQTTARLGVDYNLILPRTTLFTFVALERNLPANLKLDLEEGFLGIKIDIVPRSAWQIDASFAPVYNYRSILEPAGTGSTALIDASSSTLRGSFRGRLTYRTSTYGFAEVAEFLPLLVGESPVPENDVWDRSIFRNTVVLHIDLSDRFAFRQELKYTRDLAMRAQATCPDSSNPLCLGYSITTTTSLIAKVEL